VRMHNIIRSVFAFSPVISLSNCIILKVLKVDIAMAVTEIRIVINLLSHPGIDSSVV
jgi:hypothetical protein